MHTYANSLIFWWWCLWMIYTYPLEQSSCFHGERWIDRNKEQDQIFDLVGVLVSHRIQPSRVRGVHHMHFAPSYPNNLRGRCYDQLSHSPTHPAMLTASYAILGSMCPYIKKKNKIIFLFFNLLIIYFLKKS